MTSRFSELVVDCHDPKKMADFWAAVLGYKILDEQDGIVEIGIEEVNRDQMREAPIVPTILFAVVSEGKTVKNRLHIDVNPHDSTQEEEVERLLALGATHADVGQGDVHWVVLRDPEGNEFCVLSSVAS